MRALPCEGERDRLEESGRLFVATAMVLAYLVGVDLSERHDGKGCLSLPSLAAMWWWKGRAGRGGEKRIVYDCEGCYSRYSRVD